MDNSEDRVKGIVRNYKKWKESDNYIYVIAELSANHGKNIDTVLASVGAAKSCGADAVKIQTYTADTITLECDNEHFQIKQGTIWDGVTLHQLYSEAFMPWEWHEAIRDEAIRCGLDFFSTPFDPSAVDFLEALGVELYKIASFEINDIPLIEYVASKGKPIFISTGIATFEEIEEALSVCRKAGNSDVTLLKCTSSYPASPEDANLLTIVDMAQTFKCSVGLSDHTLGSVVPIAAVALGARVVEKHFILDRSIGSPDASFSLTPEEFRDMVKYVRIAEKTRGRVTYDLSEGVKQNRHFSRSLFVVKDIKKGDVFTSDNVRSIRPGTGLHTRYLKDIINKKARYDIPMGTPIAWDLLA